MKINYDEDGDILHITANKKVLEPVNEHTDDDVVIRRHPVTGEVVGATVLDFSERDEVDLDLS